MRYAICKPATGEIIQLMYAPEEDVASACDHIGMDYVLYEGDVKNMFVQDGEVILRPTSPAYVDDSFLRDVPTPSTLVINGVSYENSSNTVELEITDVGRYTVKVISWPYLDSEYEVVK